MMEGAIDNLPEEASHSEIFGGASPFHQRYNLAYVWVHLTLVRESMIDQAPSAPVCLWWRVASLAISHAVFSHEVDHSARAADRRKRRQQTTTNNKTKNTDEEIHTYLYSR